jgi:hypothetical protein
MIITRKKTRTVYVMPKEQIHLHFINDTVAVLSTSMLAGRVTTDTAPTPADAAGAVVGGGWHEVPTRTRMYTYIDADAITAPQIRAKATKAGLNADHDEIRIPHNHTLLQREIDGRIQYALVTTDGRVLID